MGMVIGELFSASFRPVANSRRGLPCAILDCIDSYRSLSYQVPHGMLPPLAPRLVLSLTNTLHRWRYIGRGHAQPWRRAGPKETGQPSYGLEGYNKGGLREFGSAGGSMRHPTEPADNIVGQGGRVVVTGRMSHGRHLK